MKRILTVLGIVTLVAWVAIANLHRGSSVGMRRSGSATLVRNMRNALIAYSNDYNEFPGGDYAQVCRALFGENPQKQKYIETSTKGVNAVGEIVDQWGTPLRVNLSPHPHAPRVQSAGKNRVFEPSSEDSDDIYSWE